MCYICEYCCICLCDKNDLQSLSDSDNDEVNYYIKLTSLIPEMCFNEMTDQKLLCKECCDIVDTIYKYREKCLKSKIILIDYISKLHSVNEGDKTKRISSEASGSEDKIEEIFIKTELVEETTLDRSYSNEFNQYDKIDVFSNNFNQDYIKKEMNYDDNWENLEEKHNLANVEESNINSKDEQLQSMECERADTSFSSSVKSENNYEGSTSQEDSSRKTHVNIATYEEPSSSYTTSNPESAKKTTQNKLKCEICRKIFPYKSKLNRHVLTHIGKESHTCSKCHSTFATTYDLQQHVIEYCEETSSTNYENERKYACSDCDKKFKKKSHLDDHMTLHTGLKPYECIKCHMKFARSYYLKAHQIKKCIIELHECDKCTKSFADINKLAEHKRMHSGEKRFQCNVCNMKLPQKSHLIIHMRTHTDERPFQCNICDKKFRRIENLKIHTLSHPEGKLYECKICNKKFVTETTVADHIRIHIGLKFNDDTIEADTVSKIENIREHVLVHTSRKTCFEKLSCDICCKKFFSKNNYNAHMRIHN